MKKTNIWKKLLTFGLLGGALLFQAPTCSEQAAVVTAVSSAVSAGGVIYIVDRIVRE